MTVAARPTPDIALPPITTWQLRNVRTKESRAYDQSELSIEGEARLLTLVRDAGAKLNEDGFDWQALIDLFEPSKDMDWFGATKLLGVVAAQLPDVVAEAATIFLGVYPTNEDGSRNADFEGEKRFIKGAVKFTTFIDMVKTFAEQNDYQRLADPIGAILGTTMKTGMATNTPSISNDDASSES